MIVHKSQLSICICGMGGIFEHFGFVNNEPRFLAWVLTQSR